MGIYKVSESFVEGVFFVLPFCDFAHQLHAEQNKTMTKQSHAVFSFSYHITFSSWHTNVPWKLFCKIDFHG